MLSVGAVCTSAGPSQPQTLTSDERSEGLPVTQEDLARTVANTVLAAAVVLCTLNCSGFPNRCIGFAFFSPTRSSVCLKPLLNSVLTSIAHS